MNKKYFLYAIIPSVLSASVGMVSYAAQNQEQNLISDLATRMSQKFNLNEADVLSVIEEHRAEMQTFRDQKRQENQQNMKQRFLEKLNQAVSEGKITQAQADLIVAKRTEIKAQAEDFNPTEMKTRMDSLKQWANDNNIPIEYLMGFEGKRMGPGLKNGPNAVGSCLLD